MTTETVADETAASCSGRRVRTSAVRPPASPSSLPGGDSRVRGAAEEAAGSPDTEDEPA